METIEKGYYRLKNEFTGAMHDVNNASYEETDDPSKLRFSIFPLRKGQVVYLTGYDADGNYYTALYCGRKICIVAGLEMVHEMFEKIEGKEETIEILYDNKK